MASLVPGLVAVALMIVWSADAGGFNDGTWYWGALILLGLLAGTVVALGRRRPPLGRLTWAAVLLFALYVAWSYLSITWAQAPGVALDGSNRALLYLILFCLLLLLPWTVEATVAALAVLCVGVGVVVIIVLFRLAAGDHVAAMFIGGRLASPTGYENSSAALFMTETLLGVGLASRRELPGPLRGLLTVFAGASLQLAVIVQSRGWLFTLPIVVVIVAFVLRGRLRVAAAAVIPILLALIPLRLLLRIYDSGAGPNLNHAATRAGREALVLLGLGFVVATLLAWADQLHRGRGLTALQRRIAGVAVVSVIVAGGCAGALVISHGRPGQFASRQWHGFVHGQYQSSGSHFADVGSSRSDFWRVAIDAFVAHPIGGLGQDNFADYYVTRRRTPEEPEWTHSWELRLLTHTGVVGFLLFVGFLVCALIALRRGRRRAGPRITVVTGIALLPLVDWLVHGSLDWFWEVPALSGPALGFLAAALALTRAPLPTSALVQRGQPAGRPVRVVLGLAALAAGIVVLAIPYLGVREISLANEVSGRDPAAALADLATAARLNPLDSDPGRLAGAIALREGKYATALQRFDQALARERGDWFSWLGAGLAESSLDDRTAARHDFSASYAINNRQPAIKQALRRVDSLHPLTPGQAFRLLVLVD